MKTKMTSLTDIATKLKEKDCFCILTHQYPDGDTLGSACALCKALQKTGKMAKVLNNNEIPKKYNFLFSGIINQDFMPEYIISVDVANTTLLGNNLSEYKDKINLKIDHHIETTPFAQTSYIDPTAASTAEIIYSLINAMYVSIDKDIANALYTGISTDTGCFKYANVTPETHKIAARMIELGADHYLINKIMFDTKSKHRIELEKLVYNSIEYYFESKCAVISITNKMLLESSVKDEGDLEGFASIPRKIEGVLVGVTLREKEDGVFKISVRTDEKLDASKICMHLGGGGHKAAAGCTVKGGIEKAKNQILQAIKTEMENL